MIDRARRFVGNRPLILPVQRRYVHLQVVGDLNRWIGARRCSQLADGRLVFEIEVQGQGKAVVRAGLAGQGTVDEEAGRSRERETKIGRHLETSGSQDQVTQVTSQLDPWQSQYWNTQSLVDGSRHSDGRYLEEGVLDADWPWLSP